MKIYSLLHSSCFSFKSTQLGNLDVCKNIFSITNNINQLTTPVPFNFQNQLIYFFCNSNFFKLYIFVKFYLYPKPLRNEAGYTQPYLIPFIKKSACNKTESIPEQRLGNGGFKLKRLM